jgi:uncharacterized damage-inducible protein DinB
MSLAEALLTEFDQEMKSTRTLLERVPLDEPDWKPHAKSRTIRELASHVADLPGMLVRVAGASEWEATSPRPPRPPVATTEDLLARFDEQVAAGRGALAGQGDGALTAPWTFKYGGREMFTIPKTAAIRKIVLSHLVHHRGQLTVYLRLRDVPLPVIYGPTADQPV